MQCPKCGSDNWRMASLLYAEGYSVQKGFFTRTNQTALAKSVAPPTISKAIFFVVIIVCLISMPSAIKEDASGITVIAITLGLFAVLVVRNFFAMNQWKRTAICMKCGQSFLA